MTRRRSIATLMLFACFALVDRVASAQTFLCPAGVTPVRITFLNGIFTTEDGAVRAAVDLQDAVTADSRWADIQQECVEFAYDYNKLRFVKLQKVLDLYQVLTQYSAASTSEALDMLAGAIPTSSSFSQFLLSWAADGVDRTGCFIASPLECEKWEASVVNVISSGKKLVAVAHSQGNLYANATLGHLFSGQVANRDMYSLIAVGTPDPLSGELASYTNLRLDPVAALSGLLNNATNPTCSFIDCHYFSTSYLVASESKRRILNDIYAHLPRVNKMPSAGFVVTGSGIAPRASSPPAPVTPTITATAVAFCDCADFSFDGRVPNSSDSDGFVAAWKWSIDGVDENVDQSLSLLERSLFPGRHAISLVVKDNHGDSSTAARAEVVVLPAATSLPVAIDDGPFTAVQGGVFSQDAPGLLSNDLNTHTGDTIEFVAPFPPAGLTNKPPYNGGFSVDLSSNPTFVGTMTLHYVIHVGGDTSPSNTSNEATVTVNVTPRTSTARFSFTGTVSSVLGSQLSSIQIGSTVSGEFVYDLDAVDQQPTFATAKYLYTSGPSGIALRVNGLTFGTAVSRGVAVDVWNDLVVPAAPPSGTAHVDRLSVSGEADVSTWPSSMPATGTRSISVTLSRVEADAATIPNFLTSRALPSALNVDLANFKGGIIQIGPNNSESLTFTIDSLSSISIPRVPAHFVNGTTLICDSPPYSGTAFGYYRIGLAPGDETYFESETRGTGLCTGSFNAPGNVTNVGRNVLTMYSSSDTSVPYGFVEFMCHAPVAGAGDCEIVTPDSGLRFTYTDIGLLPGYGSSCGNGISLNGMVTGLAQSPIGFSSPSYTGFMYRPGIGMTNLGILPGGHGSSGQAVNSNGVVAGWTGIDIQVPGVPSIVGIEHAFTYTTAGGLVDLGTFGGSHDATSMSNAYGINETGHVTGTAGAWPTANSLYQRPFIYRPETGVMENIGTLAEAGNAVGHAINDSDQVTGFVRMLGTGAFRAFLYTPGAGMREVGTLGGLNNQGKAINSLGQIVGESDAGPGQVHAFLYNPGTTAPVDLGTLGGGQSDAYGINGSGWIVGHSNMNAQSDKVPYLYRPGVGMVELAALTDGVPVGWRLFAVNAINDAGQITGCAISETPDGIQRAMVLTPQ